MEERFSTDQLVAAIKKVVQKNGKKPDIVKELGLDPEKKEDREEVYTAFQSLKSAGVQVPTFRRSGLVLTKEQIAKYNKDLAK